MINSITDVFTLSNGAAIPAVGYGTFQTPDGEATREAVKLAIKAGYRHIDTAFAYGNEVSVGEGIRESGVAREDIYLTTKHWVTERGYEKTAAAIETSLKNLGTDYLDLYLIHWPCVEKVSADWKEINASTWKAMEDAYKAGKIKAIGVSNFDVKHLEALWDMCEIKPMVNQLEYHPGYLQAENVAWCRDHGVLVEAWSPLGCGAVLGDERLAAIAAKYGKSVAQLCIRFVLQNGVLPLPKSVHEDRMIANTQIFDFEISAEDMAAIEAIEGLGLSGWYPEEGPAETYYD